MGTLNLGILAHVDAGKTTLTERLLYAAGVIDHIGSVDEGTTQTDSLALERERGITIKSAVASFAVDDLAVNILDTPGHPDFIAEVERVLSVLDGAVLVVSAVEGVQPQTPLLMRALLRLRIPTLVFVNKIDRPGASVDRTLEAMSKRLTPAVVPMGAPLGLGTREASFAPDAERDAALAEGTKRGLVHPVFFGSAKTGAGVDALMAGIADLLRPPDAPTAGPLSGMVFKIERTATGERVAYARLFTGTVRVRDRVRYGTDGGGRVTAIKASLPGGAVRRASLSAGEIGKLSGLGQVQIGDEIGDGPVAGAGHQFPPPTLESVVAPRDAAEKGRLLGALAQLAELDPLIGLRLDDSRGEVSVSLYGEVQKEVIQATLSREYGIEAEFRDTTTICVERPIRAAAALEILYAKTKANVTGKSSPTSTNPYPATVGLRVAPTPSGSGIAFRLDVDVRLVPLYIYRTVDAFSAQMHQYVREALAAGPAGWRVTDCVVTMFDCGYRAPSTTAADFRKVVPLVLARALEGAGTRVCEPMANVRLDVPAYTGSVVAGLLARLRSHPVSSVTRGDVCTMEAVVSAAGVQQLRRRLPAITAGEGVIESRFSGYQPVSGPRPRRRR